MFGKAEKKKGTYCSFAIHEQRSVTKCWCRDRVARGRRMSKVLPARGHGLAVVLLQWLEICRLEHGARQPAGTGDTRSTGKKKERKKSEATIADWWWCRADSQVRGGPHRSGAARRRRRRVHGARGERRRQSPRCFTAVGSAIDGAESSSRLDCLLDYAAGLARSSRWRWWLCFYTEPSRPDQRKGIRCGGVAPLLLFNYSMLHVS